MKYTVFLLMAFLSMGSQTAGVVLLFSTENNDIVGYSLVAFGALIIAILNAAYLKEQVSKEVSKKEISKNTCKSDGKCLSCKCNKNL